MLNVFKTPRMVALALLAALCAGCVQPDATPTATLAPTSTEAAQPTEAPPEQPTATTPDRTPEAGQQPQPTAAAPATPVPGQSDGQIEAIEAAVPDVQNPRVLAEAFRNTGPLPEVARTTPLDVKVGDVETFWVSDQDANENYQIQAELRYAGPVVLMYVDTSVEYDQAALEKSAREFEQRIYPRNRLLFGEERAPGIDGDKRLTVLNTLVRGAGGYFSPKDGIVRGANRFSNERDMFVIDIGGYPFGSEDYASTLAHEFQHMIHDSQQPQSASWFNEGMSTLAEDLNGYSSQYVALLYLSDTDLPMLDWASDPNHYGMAQLFLRYFYEQYAGADVLQELIRNNSGYNLEEFATLAARKRGDVTTFEDIFADWATANLLNDPSVGDGRYAYSLLPHTVGLEQPQTGSFDATIHQYGVDYIPLPAGATLDFEGATTVSLAGVPPAEGAHAWWSGRRDQSVSTLTRPVDLSGVSQATLQFKTWYEIERNWDYAFVTVSTDGGTNWKPLEATTSTSEDPQDANFGYGITGISGGGDSDLGDGVQGKWVDETADLSAYAGQEVLLRFWMITDTAVDGTNILLDDIRIPQINLADGAENGDAGWQAKGFVPVSGTLPQRWDVRLVRENAGQTSVEPVQLDAQGHAEVALDDGERGVLVVTAVTPFTSRQADYRYSIAP
ncbi:MAG TPA: hypothetical protein VFT99_09660 [Roseiflexaceae bacterium]|nr:hypothetical protein [Roseiflexaceae bacterium]